MAISKKSKKNLLIFFGIIGTLFALPTLWNLRLVGTWNATPWAQIQAQYPGIRLGLFTNNVTVSSRPDLVGTLSGNTITWTNGQTWTRT